MFQLTIPVHDKNPPPVKDTKTLQEYYLLQNASRIKRHCNENETPRLATPDKQEILLLADSFSKHRLRKQQQLLHDIALRCREQEIDDLSSAMSSKVNLAQNDGKSNVTQDDGKATLSQNDGKSTQNDPKDSAKETGVETEAIDTARPNSRPAFDKSKTFFPSRQPKQNHSRDYTLRSLPRLQISYRKGVVPSDTYQRPHLVLDRRINGQVQLNHYLHPKQDHLAPLVLPCVKYVGYGFDKNRVDSYVSSQKMILGPKSKTMIEESVSHAEVPPLQVNPDAKLNTLDTMTTGALSTDRPKPSKPMLSSLVLDPFL